jgi:hypothetical protein
LRKVEGLNRLRRIINGIFEIVMKKKHDVGQENERLSAALKKWKMTKELPVDFKSTVWQRISCNESLHTKGLEQLLQWFSALGNRKRFVVSYLSVSVLLGVLLGLVHAKSESEEFRNFMGNRYVSLIDPSTHSNR